MIKIVAILYPALIFDTRKQNAKRSRNTLKKRYDRGSTGSKDEHLSVLIAHLKRPMALHNPSHGTHP